MCGSCVVDQADGKSNYVGSWPDCCVALFSALMQPNQEDHSPTHWSAPAAV